MNAEENRATRFALFKRVLSEAAKSQPLSPAFHAYKAAPSDAARRDAYARMTAADRNAIIEEATRLMRARDEVLAAERRAADEKIASQNAAQLTACRVAEASPISSLPAAARRRAKFRSTSFKIASHIGNSLGWTLVTFFIIGNIISFILSLIYGWAVWLLLASACLAIYLVVMIAAHWSTIISVLKSLPAAISAAVLGDRSG
jgi:hypothetical protein